MIFDYLNPWDKEIFFAFQSVRHPVLDILLGFPTILGDTWFLLSAIVLLILFLDRDRAAEKITSVVFAVLTCYWVVEPLKSFFMRPRPYRLWPGVTLTFGTAWSYAFPSGHTATAFAAAYLLNRFYGGRMLWLYGIAAWVGITRIYTGVHYPTDVLGGAVLGIACAAFAGIVLDRMGIKCKK